jgi:tetratricopeptide (TPR) repeat protein
MLVIESLAVFSALLVAAAVMLFLSNRYIFEKKAGLNAINGSSRKWVVAGIVIVVLLGGGLLYKTGVGSSFATKVKTVYSYYQDPDRMSKLDHELNDNSIYDRLLLYGNSLKMFTDYPVTGCGVGNWRIYFPRYGVSGSPYLVSGRLRYEHPHNDYLFLLCEMGIAGVIAWIGMLIAALYLVVRKLKDPAASRKLKWLLVFMAGGVVAFATVSDFSYPRERFFTMFLLMITLAVITYFTDNPAIKHKSVSKPVLLLCIVLFAATTWMHAIHVKSEIIFRAAQNRQVHKDYPMMLRYIKNAQTDLFPLDITSTPLNWYRGMAHYYLGDSIAALSCYEKAYEENPYHIQVLSDLGALLEKQGRYPEALHAFRQSLEINPHFAEAFYNIGVTHFKAGNTDSAFYYLNLYPHAHHRAYQKMMSEILAYDLSLYAQQHHDTLLVNVLNEQIKKDKLFLFKKYEKASRNHREFVQSVLEMKK